MSVSFKIKNSINEEVEIIKTPVQPESNARFVEKFASVGQYGEMRFTKISSRLLEFWPSFYKTNYETVFMAEVPHSILEAHITLQNRMVQSLGRSQNTIFEKGEFNMTYAPYMENRTLFPKGGEYATFDIHPSEPILLSLAEDFNVLDQFLEKRETSTEAIHLYGQKCFIGPEMQILVSRILKNTQLPNCPKMLIDALGSELLVLFLLRSQITNLTPLRKHHRNIEALLEVRDIIAYEAENYDSEDQFSTELQLAKKVYISLAQLKFGFPKKFGTTPYQMRLELRLKKAQRLLRNTSKSILDVALTTGFQTSEGFIRAYKKHFEITPNTDRG
ncbi:hypothetical protein GCM10027051_32550 [Niabella terrae]